MWRALSNLELETHHGEYNFFVVGQKCVIKMLKILMKKAQSNLKYIENLSYLEVGKHTEA